MADHKIILHPVESTKIAWLNTTPAGWVQLVVCGVVVDSTYNKNDYDVMAAKVAEINSAMMQALPGSPTGKGE